MIKKALLVCVLTCAALMVGLGTKAQAGTYQSCAHEFDIYEISIIEHDWASNNLPAPQVRPYWQEMVVSRRAFELCMML
ncbi:hypothetical protein [Marinicella meishanensis]|uniref:hypothetical protein n=1 Tax=Marinicella meishanensis TaxID=2873263 RepID=UPI001CBFF60F|nr:hypothetical protein [Marinicella sp. NBU2979]